MIGLDLGNVLNQVETIKGNRTINALNQQKLQSNVLAQRTGQAQNALLQQFLAGDQRAFNQLDPQTQQQILANQATQQGLVTGQQDIAQGQREAQQVEAQQNIIKADQVINSASPKALVAVLFPDVKDQIEQLLGIPYEDVTRGQVVAIAKRFKQQALAPATAGVTPTAPKSASLKTFRNTETNETLTVDLTNPEDVAIIRNNPDQFVPVESKVITGTPRDFAPLGRKAEGSVQEDIIALEDSFARVGEIGNEFKRDFLTFQGRIRSSVSSLLDKADVDITKEDRDFIKSRKKFVTKVNREFNLYRKLITGAAAAEKELADLKKATINEDLGPIEFEAALEVYQEELQRGLRLKRALLRNGIRVGTDEFSKSFDDSFLSGADDDADLRLQELQDGGLSVDEAVNKLIEEGYQ